MSFTTPTISYLDAYWILSGPKYLPSGFSFLKNRRAKASLITATGRVVAVSSSEFVTFLTSVVVCGRKAPKSICQEALPGFLRLRSGQALRLRAIKPFDMRQICEALRSELVNF